MKSVGPIGLELELLAPPGKTRFDLARALTKSVGGALRRSWKYHGAGTLPDGRPDCQLTPAARIHVKGKWFASVVDDPTIVDDLAPTKAVGPLPDPLPRGERETGLRIARTDDVRLAAWMERRCGPRFAELERLLDARPDAEGFVDPWGHPLLRWHEVPAERARVCEVVLRPLTPRELGPTLRRVMKLARAEGFTVPAEAAVHAHFDAAPFRSTTMLRRLMRAWTKERAALLRDLEPNPRCRKVGPWPDDVLRVAALAEDDLPFETFAAGLLLAGLHRAVDLNLLGVVERYPKQPTVEVRCLPGSLDPEATLLRVERAARFLSRVLSR